MHSPQREAEVTCRYTADTEWHSLMDGSEILTITITTTTTIFRQMKRVQLTTVAMRSMASTQVARGSLQFQVSEDRYDV